VEAVGGREREIGWPLVREVGSEVMALVKRRRSCGWHRWLEVWWAAAARAEVGVGVCMEVAVAPPASRACAWISEQVARNGQEDRAEMRETDKSKRSNW